jgi:hypothetical protein
MDLLKMAAGFGLLKDLNAIWKSLDDSAQEKLDKVVCAAVEKFIHSDNTDIAPVRAHLLTKSIPFVERVSMAALHPGTKSFLLTRKNGPAVNDGLSVGDVPADILVTCLNCGMSKSVHLHDDYEQIEDLTV